MPEFGREAGNHTMKDYYAVLGVDREASPDQIKKAYRQLAKRFHPDVNGGDAQAEARFKQIHEAYSTLGNPELRAAYNQQPRSTRKTNVKCSISYS